MLITQWCGLFTGAKTIKKNTNSTQNKSQTHRARAYEVTSFLSTDCELSTETCSKNVYSLGPWSNPGWWYNMPSTEHSELYLPGPHLVAIEFFFSNCWLNNVKLCLVIPILSLLVILVAFILYSRWFVSLPDHTTTEHTPLRSVAILWGRVSSLYCILGPDEEGGVGCGTFILYTLISPTWSISLQDNWRWMCYFVLFCPINLQCFIFQYPCLQLMCTHTHARKNKRTQEQTHTLYAPVSISSGSYEMGMELAQSGSHDVEWPICWPWWIVAIPSVNSTAAAFLRY